MNKKYGEVLEAIGYQVHEKEGALVVVLEGGWIEVKEGGVSAYVSGGELTEVLGRAKAISREREFICELLGRVWENAGCFL